MVQNHFGPIEGQGIRLDTTPKKRRLAFDFKSKKISIKQAIFINEILSFQVKAHKQKKIKFFLLILPFFSLFNNKMINFFKKLNSIKSQSRAQRPKTLSGLFILPFFSFAFHRLRRLNGDRHQTVQFQKYFDHNESGSLLHPN